MSVPLITNSSRWFHSNVNGAQAECMLKAPNVPDGTFLVRPSSTPGDFSLSVRRDADKVTHVRIRKTADDCFALPGGEAFASVAELVQFYFEKEPAQLREKDGGLIELKYPFYATDPTPERWFHAGLSGKGAEQLLKEQGKNGSFLVRESLSVAGSYAISLRNDENGTPTVTHIIINCKDNQYDVGGGDKFNTLSDLIEHYKAHAMVETTGSVMHLKHPFNSTRIWAADLKKKIDFMETADATKNRSGFWDEFEAVQQNECKHWLSRREGQKAENRAKNRFKNILPYDHTRVVLRVDDDSPLPSDYINANVIQILPEYEEFGVVQKSYISCQGCLPNTVDDFWRMIWQENCPIIVMTTKEIEKGKSKCIRYWPELGKSKNHGLKGELVLSTLSEQIKPEYVVRKFSLQKFGCPAERTVSHFQYTAWPDHGVPSDPGSVLGFLDQVNDCLEKGCGSPDAARYPVCVHCSAGIGRSGTFIAVDLIVGQLKKQGIDTVIDISRTVQMIRTQRSGMVQTEAQYKFVYSAVACYVDAVARHLAEHQRAESAGREYCNIQYTVAANAALSSSSPGQRTPTTPSNFLSSPTSNYVPSPTMVGGAGGRRSPPAHSNVLPAAFVVGAANVVGGGGGGGGDWATTKPSSTATPSPHSSEDATTPTKPLRLDPPPVGPRRLALSTR